MLASARHRDPTRHSTHSSAACDQDITLYSCSHARVADQLACMSHAVGAPLHQRPHVLAVSSSFKHILYSSPAGAFTEYITRAPIGSVFPAGTVAQRFGRDLLVVVLHLLSNPSCRREVGASWTDVTVTLVAGIGGPAAEVAGLVARPLPLGEMAHVVAQLGCDRGLHQHVPLRVQSVPFVGGVNVLVDTST